MNKKKCAVSHIFTYLYVYRCLAASFIYVIFRGDFNLLNVYDVYSQQIRIIRSMKYGFILASNDFSSFQIIQPLVELQTKKNALLNIGYNRAAE